VPPRKEWTVERTLTATQRSAVAAVTTLKQPQTMRSGSEPARGGRRCRGASPPPPACGEDEDEEEGPAAADEFAMARVQARGGSPLGRRGEVGWGGSEWKESEARRVRWEAGACRAEEEHEGPVGAAYGHYWWARDRGSLQRWWTWCRRAAKARGGGVRPWGQTRFDTWARDWARGARSFLKKIRIQSVLA